MMARLSHVPFRANGKVMVRTFAKLKKAFLSLKREAGLKNRPAMTSIRQRVLIRTASGLRAHLGFLPKSLSASAADLFAITRIGRDRVILVLRSTGGGYRVSGLYR